jgi:hypothetical protein
MIVHLVDGTYELFRCYYGNKHFNRPDDRRGAKSAAAVLYHPFVIWRNGLATFSPPGLCPK